jgi:hypothetical protein
MRSSKNALTLAFVVSAVTGLIAWQAYKACFKMLDQISRTSLEVQTNE